jgi:hypothetical protein
MCNHPLSRSQVKLQPCGGCRQVQYCSAECQREDWHAGHKAVCAREPADDAAEEHGPSAGPEHVHEKGQPLPASPEQVDSCGLCGEREGPLRACARCRAIKYCSRACQVADWRRHKRVCVSREARPAPS